jgi:hypothetical protein
MLVHDAVAVIVEPITVLGRLGVNARVEVVAVFERWPPITVEVNVNVSVNVNVASVATIVVTRGMTVGPLVALGALGFTAGHPGGDRAEGGEDEEPERGGHARSPLWEPAGRAQPGA